jgi:ABC-2 type transport system permease protein
MTKYLNYYKILIKTKLMAVMEYRAEMVSTNLGTYAYTAMSVIFLEVLFRNMRSVAGWSLPEVMVLFGMGQWLFYTYYSFFWATFRKFSENVIQGKLDGYLLKPISPLFSSITAEFQLIETMPSLILPWLIFAYAGQSLAIPWREHGLMAGISLGLGISIFLLASLSISLLSFWLSDTMPLMLMLHNVADFQKYPVEIFPHGIRWVFLTVLPAGVMAYPATVMLLQGFDARLLGYQLLSLGMFAGLGWWLWTRGLRRYGSASS